MLEIMIITNLAFVEVNLVFKKHMFLLQKRVGFTLL